jgi:flavodoxin
MKMKSLIVVQSIHHHSTQQVGEVIGRVLDADVRSPDSVSPDDLASYDLIGFGSGIYFASFHFSLTGLVKRLKAAYPGQRVFIFSTSGLPFFSRLYHYPLKRRLARGGFDVIGEFHCSGHDTFGPLWFFGGLNRHHPNEHDLAQAEAFARGLLTTHRPHSKIADNQS